MVNPNSRSKVSHEELFEKFPKRGRYAAIISFPRPPPPSRDRRGRCGAIRLLFTKKFAPGSGDTRGDSLLQKLLGFTLKFLTYYAFHLSPAQHARALTGVKRELSSPVRKRILPQWAGASFAFTREKRE